MKSMFYPRLAVQNIKKNAKTYIPYLLTGIITTMMFYIISSLTYNPNLGRMGSSSLKPILACGCVIVAIFTFIFLQYTNGFLVKRRKKEFGLYNILGMEKKHIGRIMMYESIISFVLCMVIGLGLGMIFEKVIFLILVKLVDFEVKMGFEISGKAITSTVVLFGITFFLTLVRNLFQVHITNPIQLLNGGKVGEREPRTKWILTLVGLITVGIGYYLAVTTENPIRAVGVFLVAAILVIIGTYCLFTSGSIALLKLLRKNKRYYYKTNHFVTISGMIYRMKQNAVGLANICILSCAVLVSVSTTICLYIGVQDGLDTNYPYDIEAKAYVELTKEQREECKNITYQLANEHGRDVLDYRAFHELSFASERMENTFVLRKSAAEIPDNKMMMLSFVTVEDYNALTGAQITLLEDEILIYSDQTMKLNEVELFGTTYRIKDRLKDISYLEENSVQNIGIPICHVVVCDEETLQHLYQQQADAYEENKSSIKHIIQFNTDGTSGDKIAFYEALKKKLPTVYKNMYLVCKQETESDFYATYGGMLFLGIFLGIIFTMATVLIIYYKQISEGYEDRKSVV